MMRALPVIVAITVGLLALGVAGAAEATGRVQATLTSKIPANKSGGDRVVVAWKLRDGSGHAVSVKHVFVKIVCPTGTDYTTTLAAARADGTYRAVAVVPPGGIGTISIGTAKSTFPITNPFRRSH